MITLVPPGMTPDKPLYTEGTEAEDGVRARAAALQAAGQVAATLTTGGFMAGRISADDFADSFAKTMWGIVDTFENYILTGEHR